MTYKLMAFDKIESTQTMAHEIIAAGDARDRTVICANQQTAGRGRYRRTWVSPAGNLYASFVYKSEKRDPKLSYAVAVAVAETLISFGIEAGIKWPNDVLVDSKKISGILIEYVRDFVVIGIGINITDNPIVTAKYQTAKTSDYAAATRDDILAELMTQMDRWVGRGFADVRQRWTDLAVSLNHEIVYHNRPAIFCGINDRGACVLRRGTEYLVVYGDEISI